MRSPKPMKYKRRDNHKFGILRIYMKDRFEMMLNHKYRVRRAVGSVIDQLADTAEIKPEPIKETAPQAFVWERDIDKIS